MRRRWRLVAAGVVASGLVISGCGGEDETVDERRTSPPPSSTTQPTIAVATPEFTSSVAPVTAEDLGASWTDGLGCAPPDDLVAVSVTHHGLDGEVLEGRIVVAAAVADDVVAVFARLFDAGFPITRMEPVSAFGGDDDASMRADNTSGYNCRTVAGTTRLSQHAFGLAIDVNPLRNPWLHDGVVDPPEGAVFADRSRTDPGMIHPDDVVVRAFADHGWSWGGDWDEPDYQHFSTTGR